MINEQENKASLDKMSDLEYAKNDTEMMRYRVNGLSNKLGLLAMGCSIFAGLFALNSFQPRDFQVLVIVLINIIILLGGFLACEKVKSYNKNGAIAQVVFGGVCVGRMFYIPLILAIAYKNYLQGFTIDPNDYSDIYNEEGTEIISSATDQYNTALANAKADADNILAATITNKDSSEFAIAFLPQNGYFRAIFIMSLLAIAAGAFIAAGLTGYLKAKKLSTYLESIKAKD